MTARTHDAFAFASLITVTAYFPPGEINLVTAFAAVVGNIIGATIPDIDQASNRLWKFLPAGEHLGRVLRRAFIRHRTLTHSFLGMFLVYRILAWLLPKILNENYLNVNVIFAAIMIGYISHLVADFVTKDGLPLLFPIKWNIGFPPISQLRITAGSWVENLVVLPGIGIYVFWFIGRNQDVLLEILRNINR